MRKAFMLGVFVCMAIAVTAQAYLPEAEKIWQWQRSAQGDSIYARFGEDLRRLVTVGSLNMGWRQLERQAGSFVHRGEWEWRREQAGEVYFVDACFERAMFRFWVAFDEEGKVTGLRWMPVPAGTGAAAAVFDSVRLEERAVSVKTGLFRLPGVVTLPCNSKDLPVVILVHGSGPNDRDGTLDPNKMYRDIAWGLAEEGVAVIRYDKRTRVYGTNCVPIGEKMTPEVEVVQDALSAIALAKTLPEADTNRIFIVGHSFGAMLAPLIAFRSGSLAGIVLMAAGARQLEEMAEEQLRYIASLSGEMTEEEIQRQLRLLLDAAPEEYWEYLRRYDPVATAVALEIPIFVMQGERDYQVTMRDFSLWQKGLAGKNDVSFKSYPSLNHCFMRGEGRIMPSEYFRPARVDSLALKDLADWIKAH